MFSFGIRNLKLFFKDKSSIFFSLLAVFIIIALYAFFLGDMMVGNLDGAPGARFLMDSWIMAGILSVTSITTTMGAFAIMVEDRAKKINKDFTASPIHNRSIVGGYIFSAIVIGIIMSLFATVLVEGYVLINGGELMGLATIAKVFGLIVLATVSSSSIVLFLVSFFNSSNAFATASTVIGTMIGFLTGIYIPIGTLPEAVQWVIKCFPPSHAASLFRQVMMEAPMAVTFNGASAEVIAGFKESMGMTFSFGDTMVTPLMSVIVLVVTAVVFYILSIWNVSRKRK